MTVRATLVVALAAIADVGTLGWVGRTVGLALPVPTVAFFTQSAPSVYAGERAAVGVFCAVWVVTIDESIAVVVRAVCAIRAAIGAPARDITGLTGITLQSAHSQLGAVIIRVIHRTVAVIIKTVVTVFDAQTHPSVRGVLRVHVGVALRCVALGDICLAGARIGSGHVSARVRHGDIGHSDVGHSDVRHSDVRHSDV